MVVYDGFEQGTEEWHEIRQGKVGGSSAHKLISLPRSKADKKEGKLGTAGSNLAKQAAAEIAANRFDQGASFKNADHGHANEVLALEIIGFEIGLDFEAFAWIERNNVHGHSPDGLIPNKIGLEVKSPAARYVHKHQSLWRSPEDLKNDYRTDSSKYYWQCINGLVVCQTPFWLFATYHADESPRLSCVLFDVADASVKADMDFLEGRIDAFNKQLTDECLTHEERALDHAEYHESLINQLSHINE